MFQLVTPRDCGSLRLFATLIVLVRTCCDAPERRAVAGCCRKMVMLRLPKCRQVVDYDMLLRNAIEHVFGSNAQLDVTRPEACASCCVQRQQNIGSLPPPYSAQLDVSVERARFAITAAHSPGTQQTEWRSYLNIAVRHRSDHQRMCATGRFTFEARPRCADGG